MLAIDDRTIQDTHEDGFGVTLTSRARHALLWQARAKCGSTKALAARLGKPYGAVMKWINLQTYPKRPLPQKTQLALVELTGYMQHELFPSAVYSQDFLDAPKQFEQTRYIDPVLLASAGGLRRIEAPDEDCYRSELRQKLYGILGALTERQEEVVRMYYGLDGQGEWTQREIADHFGLTRACISANLKQALNRLKYRTRRQILQRLMDGEEVPRPEPEPEPDMTVPRYEMPVPLQRIVKGLQLYNESYQDCPGPLWVKYPKPDVPAVPVPPTVPPNAVQKMATRSVMDGERLVECPVCHRQFIIPLHERKFCYHTQTDIEAAHAAREK